MSVSLPPFWLALIFQIFFFGFLHVLPLEGYLDPNLQFSGNFHTVTGSFLIDALITGNSAAFWNILWHMILPALTLAAYPIGLIIRQVRSSMIGVMQENYIRTARAYGVGQLRIEFIYSLKNAIIPTLVVLGLTFAYSLTGAFFVEENIWVERTSGSTPRSLFYRLIIPQLSELRSWAQFSTWG